MVDFERGCSSEENKLVQRDFICWYGVRALQRTNCIWSSRAGPTTDGDLRGRRVRMSPTLMYFLIIVKIH